MTEWGRNDKVGEIAPLARTGWLKEGVVFREGVVFGEGVAIRSTYFVSVAESVFEADPSPINVMPGRASRQQNLTGSYEACHEHRCPHIPLVSCGQAMPTRLILPEQTPPSKEDSLANASSGARQEDVALLSNTRWPERTKVLPHVIPRPDRTTTK